MAKLTPTEELHIRQALKDVRRILATGRDAAGPLSEEELAGIKKDQAQLTERLQAHYREEQDELQRWDTKYGRGEWSDA